MKKELNDIYKYFSHHIRNCTATIAASVTLISYDMVPEDSNLVSEIVEASFFLDLFDAAMNICFCHILDEPCRSTSEVFKPDASLQHFIEQAKDTFRERNVNIVMNVTSPAVIMGSAYELRTLTNMIIYEILLQSSGKVDITIFKNELTIKSSEHINIPSVFDIFKNVLAAKDVHFEYNDNGCILRYTA